MKSWKFQTVDVTGSLDRWKQDEAIGAGLSNLDKRVKPAPIASSCFHLSSEPITSAFWNFKISNFVQIHIQTSFEHNLSSVTPI